ALAVQQHLVHQLGDQRGGVDRVGDRRPFRRRALAGHQLFSFFAPYRLRACLRLRTPWVSSEPRMILYRTPGRSFTRPPRTSTIECSCRLCPTPGMYAVTSIWLVSRTRATFRSAEFGFLGVVVYTRVPTPRRCGLPLSAGVLVLPVFAWRPLRTNCWMVGIRAFVSLRPPEGGRTVYPAYPGPRGRACRRPAGSRPRSRLTGSSLFPGGVGPSSQTDNHRRAQVEPGHARAGGERVLTLSAQVKTYSGGLGR